MQFRIAVLAIAFTLFGLTSISTANLQQPNKDLAENNLTSSEPQDLKDDANNWNLELPTLGGMQFWTDHRWWNGWRVQYNKTLDHWRLLSPNNIRKAWGGRQAMIDEWNSIVSNAARTDDEYEVVLLLHGLMRTNQSMKPIATELSRLDSFESSNVGATKHPRYAIPFSYASTRDSIASHAIALRELVENLPGNPRISAVGHSMGNIVLRRAIGDWQRSGDPKHVLPRLHRVVMLGPPNQGSAFATRLSKLGLFETITGTSGLQLGSAWSEFGDTLAIPPCPFAIVAGDISESGLNNPLLSGPSDGVVTLEEAKLDGAVTTIKVPILHSFLMSDPTIVRATVSFLSGNDLVTD